jgi:hypothetical protein
MSSSIACINLDIKEMINRLHHHRTLIPNQQITYYQNQTVGNRVHKIQKVKRMRSCIN